MPGRIKSKLDVASAAVEEALKKALAKTQAKLDSEEATRLKGEALAAYEKAVAICKHLGDVNGDGKIDAEDLKAAAEKAGLIWEKFDPDLKQALLTGGVAAAALLVIPVAGHIVAIPVFAATTAYFFLFAKIKKIDK